MGEFGRRTGVTRSALCCSVSWLWRGSEGEREREREKRPAVRGGDKAAVRRLREAEQWPKTVGRASSAAADAAWRPVARVGEGMAPVAHG